MASDGDEDVSSRSHSESSDDSDSQDSDNMRVTPPADPKGDTLIRKPKDSKVKKANAKDPNRVKRKKARRACENCQRAHLTCSDNRPCERCGDKKVCKDGFRKKAKYLADAPDEALTPAQDQKTGNPFPQFPTDFRNGPFPSASFAGLGGGGIYDTGPMVYHNFSSSGPRNQMPLPPFSNQQMSMTPSYTIGPSPQSILPTYTRALQPNMSMFTNNMQGHFPRDMFPDLDMSNHNFQNNYGLGEFAMLNHMSSGMAETPPGESSGTFNSSDDANFGPGMMSTNYESGPANAQNYRFPHDLGICETSHHSRPGSRQALDVANYNLAGQDQDCLEGVVKQEERPAYAVGASYPSPISGSSPQGMTAGFDDSPTVKNMYTNLSSSRQAQAQVQARRSARPGQQPQSVSTTSPSTITAPSYPRAQTLPPQRHRTPSTIYSTVTEPYSYTKAFHDLMALIRKRFSAKKTARIAKALASIRPSFISSLTKLDDDDRVFMEKCLQRTLLEYEDFLSVIGTPTIICRRTGEVVAVGEGFSVLTGWRKAILLGEEPNFNVNKGGDSSGPPNTDASTTRGNNTPRVTDGPRPEIHDDSPLKPVSIVDLLDDESACDFFDDYSHLAFGDSRGSVTTPCRLLKYQTAKDVGVGQNLDSEVGTRLKRQRDANWSGKADSAAGVNVHSGGPNKVECMLCWSVKRDVFDIPMLFVMNFLPCI